jgi:hypothetical protein
MTMVDGSTGSVRATSMTPAPTRLRVERLLRVPVLPVRRLPRPVSSDTSTRPDVRPVPVRPDGLAAAPPDPPDPADPLGPAEGVPEPAPLDRADPTAGAMPHVSQ